MTARNISRTVVALATVLPLAVGTATVAHADSFRHRDATGDVRVASLTPSGTLTWFTNPRQRDPDTEQLTVLHSRWALSVATSLRDYDPLSNSWRAFIVTSKGDHFTVLRANDELTAEPFVNFFRNGKHVACEGFRVSPTSSGIVGKVPTRCLGNPWKVRVGVLVGRDYPGGPPYEQGFDDPLRNGAITENEPRMSPWIAR